MAVAKKISTRETAQRSGAISTENVQLLRLGLTAAGIWFGYIKIVKPLLTSDPFGLKASRKEDIQRDELFLDFAKTAFDPNFERTLGSGIVRFRYAKKDGIILAGNIYKSHQWWNDDEEQAYAVFRKAPSLSAVSSITYWFSEEYGRDLLEYLKDFLNDSEMDVILNILKAKPLLK